MASHRKSRTTFRARTFATMAGAAAASVTALAPGAYAEPAPTAQQVKAQVDELYHQAEEATERYNGTKEKVDGLQREVSLLQDELARKTDAAEAVRSRLGALAAEQYRSSGLSPAMQLALADDPQQFLERSGRLDQVGAIEQATLQQYGQQRRALDTQAAEARAKLAELADRQQQLTTEKASVQAKLAEAQSLLNRLTAAERDEIARASRGDARTPLTSADPLAAPGAVAATGRAAAAIGFARAQLGKPYVWGATGPDSFDCSGLVQAAYRSAGISLPRTTYAQIAAAPRITRDQLQPGDLVFFYAGVTHVGLYTGNGQMIHAPHPGAPVRYESISVMPFAGAVRPA
ncbi:C40 family peptidase [Kitasatospora camelliae]|uniref:NlpC/P60 family protein n=1 Tax=Kitasatospora camelliae TaxID=3156397 RepID=A0AAU8JVW2_9ACTN